MSKRDHQDGFNEIHHALLYSLIARAVQEAIQARLAEFAERYGEQAMQRIVTSRGKYYKSVSGE